MVIIIAVMVDEEKMQCVAARARPAQDVMEKLVAEIKELTRDVAREFRAY